MLRRMIYRSNEIYKERFGGMVGKHYLCDVNIVRWREGNTHRNNELNLQLATESLLIIVLMETITGSNPVLTAYDLVA